MKKLLLKKMVNHCKLNLPTSRIMLPLLLIILALSGFQAAAQQPVLTVRFANPQYDCPTQTYCLDVEFISDTPGQQLFGINLRFFYDDNILEFLHLGDFAQGYDSLGPPEILTGNIGDGGFGFAGPPEWFNSDVKLVSPSPIYLSASWTKLFNVCFHVDDPAAIGIDSFCPSIVWDLQENPALGGYFEGDDGVVMTVVGFPQSVPTTENVVQFNWVYEAIGNSVGHPVSIICISTICGYIIPLSNWALFLAIGLMIIATVFIYRRRISG
jgi:hypothetical protein